MECPQRGRKQKGWLVPLAIKPAIHLASTNNVAPDLIRGWAYLLGLDRSSQAPDQVRGDEGVFALRMAFLPERDQ
jgi:hypothetical protein